MLAEELESLVPPEGMRDQTGTGDYLEVGRHFFDLFTRFGGLKPTDCVLDAGCGMGRMALPLLGYLKPPARYEGFDIVASHVEWCQKAIHAKYPHFHFQRVDVLNRHYNPKGRFTAEKFRFPYSDGSFDFVFLTSVFTHMLPAAVENYLREIRRVVKSDGRMFATFFLWNEESSRLTKSDPRPGLEFKFQREGFMTSNEQAPEAAVALPEEWVLRTLSARGFKLCHPLQYGGWCKRPKPVSFQDFLVASPG